MWFILISLNSIDNKQELWNKPELLFRIETNKRIHVNTIASATIYRDKNKSQFKSNPTHGTPGWIESDGEFKELIYWDKDGKAEWMTGDNFKNRKRKIKEGKIAYYIQRPRELIQKILSKRRVQTRSGLIDPYRHNIGIT